MHTLLGKNRDALSKFWPVQADNYFHVVADIQINIEFEFDITHYSV